MRQQTNKSSRRRVCAFGALNALLAIAAPAQTFTSLVSFNGNNGSAPTSPLVQGLDGKFYGLTNQGYVAPNLGTFFSISAQGKLTTLHHFKATEGVTPLGLMVLANGTFYGTANLGGANNDGTVFSVTPAGTVTVLHSFNDSDGDFPQPGLVEAFNGMLYGATNTGGANNKGTVFQITPSGAFTTVYNFIGGNDGGFPSSGLFQASNGLLYGNAGGGVDSNGVVYSFSLTGIYTLVYSFPYGQGGALAPLIEGPGGNLYGTTATGGPNFDGSVFELTPGGTFTALHYFDKTDGAMLYASLALGTDGNFYGVTQQGGDRNGDGTIFQISPSGTLTTLHQFGGTDGSWPTGGLVEGTDGNFYGTTEFGGASNYGCWASMAIHRIPYPG